MSGTGAGAEPLHLVSVTLMGGVGNQLFQMAAALGVASSTGRQLVIYAPAVLRTNAHVKEDYYVRLFPDVPVTRDDDGMVMHREPDNGPFVFNPVPAYDARHLHLYGYFQHERYSEHVVREFVGGLVARLPSFPARPEACFIHVRRGDYVGNPLHCIDFFSKYYPAAMALVRQLLPDPPVKFVVFSDDVAWCREQAAFASSEFEFEAEPDPLCALALMASCSAGGICANSSFSWWGAFLNPNPRRVVTFPRKWFGRDVPVDVYFSGSHVLET